MGSRSFDRLPTINISTRICQGFSVEIDMIALNLEQYGTIPITGNIIQMFNKYAIRKSIRINRESENENMFSS